MGIIEERKALRHNSIIDIKDAIVKAKNEGIKIDYKLMAFELMAKKYISLRTAKEYIDLALFELKITKEDLLNEKQKIIL